jgi:hypothetical protein
LLRHNKRSSSVISKSDVELIEVLPDLFKRVFAWHFKYLGKGAGLESLHEVQAAHKNKEVMKRMKSTRALKNRLSKNQATDDAVRTAEMRRQVRGHLHSNFLAQKGHVKKPSWNEAMRYFSKYVEPMRLEVRNPGGLLLSHRLAKPHERHLGKPFPYWSTGSKDFAEFGIGVGLYFYLLKGLFLLCTLLFALYAPIMRYYSSEKYSSPQFPYTLQGSALCMRRVHVHLEANTHTVPTQQPTSSFSRLRSEPTPAPTTSNSGWINDCPMDHHISYTVFASFCAVVSFIVLYHRAQKKLMEKIDVSVQTLQDYSLAVTDPDNDATDPDEWMKFFEQFGEVAAVTVHKNNGDLLHALGQRAMIVRAIDYETGAKEVMRLKRWDDRVPPKVRLALQKYFGCCRDLLYWKEQLEVCDKVSDFLLEKPLILLISLPPSLSFPLSIYLSIYLSIR